MSRCPRCGGPIPSADHEGEYMGALSRVDNETEICSACGTLEAIWQLGGEPLPPVTEPIGSIQ